MAADPGRLRRLRGRLDTLPPGAALAVGVGCVLVGGFLTLRPFSSLAVLVVSLAVALVVSGLGGLVAPDEVASDEVAPDEVAPGDGDEAAGGGTATLRKLRAAAYLLVALVVLVWPGATITVLSVLVGLVLVLDGALDLWDARRLAGTARWNGLLGGLSVAVLGVLALAWPDISVLVLAVLFGMRVLLTGVRLVVQSVRARRGVRPGPRTGRPRRGRPGRWRLAGNAVALLVAAALLLASSALHRGAPTPDEFYAAPATVPGQPGQLLRSEPFTRGIPAGASAWRILYTTTRDEGQPAVASGLVVVPARAGRPTPVVAWAHGTTGVAPGCAPSVLSEPFESGAMFVLDQVLDRGWAMVAPDYLGLGTAGPHPYLIGPGTARSVLDSVRAARQLTDAGLATGTVLWGHSQGGGAALWAGQLAPTYSPDVRLDGVAALAPASNLEGLVDNLANITGWQVFASYVIGAYSEVYPDVEFDDYVRPGARILVREMASRCLSEPSVLVSVLSSLVLDKPIWQGDPDRGAFATRLRSNTPTGQVAAPLLIAQGGADSLILPSAQDDYVADRCAAGAGIDYRTYAGLDHVPLVEAGSPLVPELLAWTSDRFAGKSAASTCGR